MSSEVIRSDVADDAKRGGDASPPAGPTFASPGRVLILTSVKFAFIGYWRTSAVVLCDLSSTAYYIGGIVESYPSDGRRRAR